MKSYIAARLRKQHNRCLASVAVIGLGWGGAEVVGNHICLHNGEERRLLKFLFPNWIYFVFDWMDSSMGFFMLCTTTLRNKFLGTRKKKRAACTRDAPKVCLGSEKGTHLGAYLQYIARLLLAEALSSVPLAPRTSECL